MEAVRRDSGPPRRDIVWLGLAGTAAALGLTGCTRSAVPTPGITTVASTPPTPDQAARLRAAGEAVELLAGAGALAVDRRDLATLLTAVADDHRNHVAALGATLPSASATTTTASTGARASAPDPGRAQVLARAERTAADRLLADPGQTGDLAGTSPGLARLLARIAAARSVHADLIAAAAHLSPPPLEPARSPGQASPGQASPRPAAAPDAAVITAATAMLRGEHAAVFAYGALTARLAPALRPRAQADWNAHLARRQQLETMIRASGGTPPVALPAYQLGAKQVGGAQLGPAEAIALAITVEDGAARLAAAAVAATSGLARLDPAAALAEAARRAAAWRGAPIPFPG